MLIKIWDRRFKRKKLTMQFSKIIMNYNLAVITPIYKEELNSNEITALKHSHAIMKNRDKFFISPRNLNLSYYKNNFPEIKNISFESHYFESTKTYSKLLIQKHFYETFNKYSHILILQQDCIIFKDDLDTWISLGFDYIGAPWPKAWEFYCPKIGSPIDGFTFYVTVGNGGFSLRRVQGCIDVLMELDWLINKFNEVVEDAFFSLASHISTKYKIPNAIIAAKFSIECEPRKFYAINNHLPTGVHAWEKWDKEFWMRIFKNNNISGLE